MISFTKLGSYGQLGNQLFQYAMLLGVQAKTQYEVRIPRDYTSRKKRGLVELEPFACPVGTLNPEHRKQLKYVYVEDPHDMRFSPEVWGQKDFTDYEGYFQCEKYFAHIADEVARQFQFRKDIRDWVTENRPAYMQKVRLDRAAAEAQILARTAEVMAAEEVQPYRVIARPRLIGIQVRRGDYLRHPDHFWVLDADYYKRGLEELQFGERDAAVICTDDQEWCERNIVPLAANIRVSKAPSHWHDLALLSSCDDFVIGGSTFGWWGAWLSEKWNTSHATKVVVPRPWFPHKGPQSIEIIPDRWIGISPRRTL